jgi:hypothetical protein
MIHYWECDRCTHQWQSSCMGAMMMDKKESEHHSRHLSSGLCEDCFEQLEAEQISGLTLFELFFYLSKKSDNYGASKTWKVFNEGTPESPWYNHQKFSGMCHEYIGATYNEDGSEKTPSNFTWGETAEHKQLREITGEIEEIYKQIISSQRTPKRIELDEWQKTQRGFFFFGPQPRPEDFVGDLPGKQRLEILFGLDPVSGNIIAPTIVANDGTK